MKTQKLFWLFALALVSIFAQCKKKKDEIVPVSYNSPAIGRIIGWDPCKHYSNPGNAYVKGNGFVIERDVNGFKDTVVTYRLPEGMFAFQNSYFDGSYSSFMFNPTVQDLFKIKFNYKDAVGNEKTLVICNGLVNIADFNRAVRDKEILISDVTIR